MCINICLKIVEIPCETLRKVCQQLLLVANSVCFPLNCKRSKLQQAMITSNNGNCFFRTSRIKSNYLGYIIPILLLSSISLHENLSILRLASRTRRFFSLRSERQADTMQVNNWMGYEQKELKICVGIELDFVFVVFSINFGWIIKFCTLEARVPREIPGWKIVRARKLFMWNVVSNSNNCSSTKLSPPRGFSIFHKPQESVFSPSGTCFRAIWKTNFA